MGAVPTDLDGVDYLVTHAYKWLLSPRGLAFLYVRPERRAEIEPWTAGWKSCPEPYEDYYGFPELTEDARRLDISVPWFAAAGARRSLELLVSLGAERIADHNLSLAARFAGELGLDAPASPIVRVDVDDADVGGRAAARRRRRLLGARRLGPPLLPPLQRSGGCRPGARGARILGPDVLSGFRLIGANS